MQTFILDSNIRRSAEYLDTSRLHKQAVEIKQILLALSPGSTSRWSSHPATLQWRYYQNCLAVYGLACVDRWLELGFQSTLPPFFEARINNKRDTFPEVFHQLIPYHRALLRYKRYTHYAEMWPEEDPFYIEQHAVYLDGSDKLFKVINKQRVYVSL